jgi:hypothetical protein
MVYFQDKNPNLGQYWRILQDVGIMYGHLVYFVDSWYIFPHFGMMYQEKSANPEVHMYLCIVRTRNFIKINARQLLFWAHLNPLVKLSIFRKQICRTSANIRVLA